ncbi:MAG: hypothetical protein SFH39_09580 [Candidatus Magnetobacterium sp. LHC-1]|nr:hypothetical protein [Nitrospirota bacterium]
MSFQRRRQSIPYGRKRRIDSCFRKNYMLWQDGSSGDVYVWFMDGTPRSTPEVTWIRAYQVSGAYINANQPRGGAGTREACPPLC